MAFDAHGAYSGSGNAPMQNFQIATGNPPGGQKNYVFVDEHNRHKRLKVMRACEGCRRRKIKCDAATTNTWPCSACRRLKLQCQPPAINQEGVGLGTLSDTEADYSQTSLSGLDPSQAGIEHYGSIPPSHFANMQQYGAPMAPYPIAQYAEGPENQQQMYQQMQSGPQVTSYTALPPQSQPGVPPAASYYSPPRLRTDSSSSPLDLEASTAEGLSEALGDLKIDEDGIAPYLRKAQTTGKEPAVPVEDFDEIKLPPLSTGAGSQIRIPPALMPSDEDAARYFQVFFDDIHPYVPVVNRDHFIRQWRRDRKSISPLLLEGMFACSGRLSDDPAQGAQWLALAARHEDHFLDHPRLSTLQALILLLKAREAAPRRGYFYKSWMTVKTAVSMAKSLELDEHLDEHENGGSCDSNPVDCLMKTRIWQTLMLLEVMVGGPQGHRDFGVVLDSVDYRTNPPNSDISKEEAETSRQFAYWVRNAGNINATVMAYIKLKRQKDWGANPEFVATTDAFTKWPDELPEDLRLHLPNDGSPPQIRSHFIANMHSHYQLGIIMVQRPQLLASKTFGADAQWRHIFSTCYSSAKILCRLQEAILQSYGISGLLVMQRGINFTIYGVLTCTMLHLVAITSPYPEFNLDAREYFTRHMRILEQCTSAWPMPDLQDQVDALRKAFSADINRPFELKQSFPYSSPSSEGYQPSPPMDMHYPVNMTRDQQFDQPSQIQYQTITPPISAGPGDVKNESPHMQQVLGMPMGSHPQTTASMTQAGNLDWNPSRIINQWEGAFAISPSALAPPGSTNSPPMNLSMPQSTQSMHQAQQQYNSPYTHAAGVMTSVPQPQPIPQATYASQAPLFLTPRDWQQSVASVYDPQGLKRRWDGR